MAARRGNYSLMRIGIPALAGRSVMHGLIPPHSGPLVAIDAVGANLGITLALGVLVAIPTVIIAGPVFSRYAARWVDVSAPEGIAPERDCADTHERPSFGAAVATILLPVVLMLAKALVDIIVDRAAAVHRREVPRPDRQHADVVASQSVSRCDPSSVAAAHERSIFARCSGSKYGHPGGPQSPHSGPTSVLPHLDRLLVALHSPRNSA